MLEEGPSIDRGERERRGAVILEGVALGAARGCMSQGTPFGSVSLSVLRGSALLD